MVNKLKGMWESSQGWTVIEKSGVIPQYEGAQIKLGAMSTGDVAANKTGKIIILDGSTGTEIEKPYEMGNATGVTFTLPDVPDDKASYDVSYKLQYTLKGKLTTRRGNATYKVWPQTIHFDAKYKKGEGDVSGKNDGDLVTAVGFRVLQAGVMKPGGVLDGAGTGDAPVDKGAEASIVMDAPWEIVEPASQAGLGRKRSFQVTSKPWVAQLHSHPTNTTAEAPAKQYVNLDPTKVGAAATDGPVVKIELGPAVLASGLAGQKIHVRATFPKGNAMATYTPEPGLWLGPDVGTAVAKKSGTRHGEADVVYETTVTIPSNGGKALVFVNLGKCGGEKCTVEFGTTEARTDGKLFLESWRKLGLDMWQPTYQTMSTHAVFKPDHTAGLSDAQKTLLQDELKKAFIEFETKTTSFYTPTDVGDAKVQRVRIHDGAWFGQTGKMTVLPGWSPSYSGNEAGYDKIQTDKWTAPDPQVWFTVWADWMASKESAGIALSEELENTTAKEVTIDAPNGIFKYDLHAGDDTPGVEEIAWWATQYKKGADPWKAVDGDFAAAIGDPAKADQLQYANYPAVDTLANVEKYVEFVNWRKAKFKLSADGADSPGAQLEINGTKIKYTLYVKFRASSFSTNACAVAGWVWMSTMGEYKDQGLMATLAHEMGHNMGLAYGPRTTKVRAMALTMSTGLQRSFDTGGRTKEIPGKSFPPVVPEGVYYTGHGHTGGHCATGVSTEDKKKQSFFGASFNDSKKCLMFGSGDMNSATKVPLCPACVEHLRATDLDDISKDW